MAWEQSVRSPPNFTNLVCTYSTHSYPLISQKLFHVQSLIDKYKLTSLLGINTSSPNALNYMEGVAAFYNSTLKTLFAAKPDDGYYFVSCFVHVESTITPPMKI